MLQQTRRIWVAKQWSQQSYPRLHGSASIIRAAPAFVPYTGELNYGFHNLVKLCTRDALLQPAISSTIAARTCTTSTIRS